MDKQGSGTFLRLEGDGDKAVIAFCGSPFHRDICFNEKTKTYEAWNEETSKAAGRKKTARYAMNCFVVSDKSGSPMDMRVFDMNFQTIQQVIALRDKYGFGKKLFEITRHGAKGDTKTTYQILPDEDITTEMRAACGVPDPKDEDGWVEGSNPAPQSRRGDGQERGRGRHVRLGRRQAEGREEGEGRCEGRCRAGFRAERQRERRRQR